MYPADSDGTSAAESTGRLTDPCWRRETSADPSPSTAPLPPPSSLPTREAEFHHGSSCVCPPAVAAVRHLESRVCRTGREGGRRAPAEGTRNRCRHGWPTPARAARRPGWSSSNARQCHMPESWSTETHTSGPAERGWPRLLPSTPCRGACAAVRNDVSPDPAVKSRGRSVSADALPEAGSWTPGRGGRPRPAAPCGPTGSM